VPGVLPLPRLTAVRKEWRSLKYNVAYYISRGDEVLERHCADGDTRALFWEFKRFKGVSFPQLATPSVPRHLPSLLLVGLFHSLLQSFCWVFFTACHSFCCVFPAVLHSFFVECEMVAAQAEALFLRVNELSESDGDQVVARNSDEPGAEESSMADTFQNVRGGG
jgi:hypothetical protein